MRHFSSLDFYHFIQSAQVQKLVMTHRNGRPSTYEAVFTGNLKGYVTTIRIKSEWVIAKLTGCKGMNRYPCVMMPLILPGNQFIPEIVNVNIGTREVVFGEYLLELQINFAKGTWGIQRFTEYVETPPYTRVLFAAQL